MVAVSSSTSEFCCCFVYVHLSSKYMKHVASIEYVRWQVNNTLERMVGCEEPQNSDMGNVAYLHIKLPMAASVRPLRTMT